MKNLKRTVDEPIDSRFKVYTILFQNPVLAYVNRRERKWECRPNQNTINWAVWLFAFALNHALEEELDWVSPMISTHADGTMVITWTHFRDFHRELVVEIYPTGFHVHMQEDGESSYMVQGVYRPDPI